MCEEPSSPNSTSPNRTLTAVVARAPAGRSARAACRTTRAGPSRNTTRGIVTLKLAEGLPWLREALEGRALMHCIRAAQRPDFRIVHYSIQLDHLHMIVEADDGKALSNGMQGCNGRIALTLNRLWRQTGNVFRERFHDRALKTLREVLNALKYVLNYHLKHSVHLNPYAVPNEPDVFSSGRFFDGWLGRAPDHEAGAEGAVVVKGGWKRHHHAIGVDARPGLSSMV